MNGVEYRAERRTTPMTDNKHPSEWTEDELITALLPARPDLKVDYVDGKRVIRGIQLKKKLPGTAKEGESK